MTMPEISCSNYKIIVLRVFEKQDIPQSPNCDLSPNCPFLCLIAMFSGHPQFEQCQTPSIMFACCPSAKSRSFASFSNSRYRRAVIIFETFESGTANGASASSASSSLDESAAVFEEAVDGFARARRTLVEREGGLERPFALGILGVGKLGACGALVGSAYSH